MEVCTLSCAPLVCRNNSLVMRDCTLVLLLAGIVGSASSQNWELIQTPTAAQGSSYALEVDASDARFVLFSRGSMDSLYIANGNGDWNGGQVGDFPMAFYADDGSLFLLKDLDPSPSVLHPQLFRSTDNEMSLSEISDITGTCIYKDAHGRIFLSCPPPRASSIPPTRDSPSPM